MSGEQRRHSHIFGQDQRRSGEGRTLIVVLLTGTMMVVEIAAGIAYGSMALLADGLHMASHMVALAISLIAYIVARRQAQNPRLSFGTGKVNVLGGFTGAILLALFALAMVWESVERLLQPQDIAYHQAILVAVLGLVVNGCSALLLGHHGHGHDHHHGQAPGHEDGRQHGHGLDHHHDHNLRAAYLHVLADALTSLLAIGALLAAKYGQLDWMDPAVGILGALLVARWSWGLLRTTGGILLDRQADDGLVERVRTAWQEQPDTVVHDLHLWSIGPGIYNLTAVLSAPAGRTADDYRTVLPDDLGVVHATIEVHQQATDR